MKKSLTIAALAILFVSGAALADTVAIISQTSFADPSGGSIQSSNSYAFKGVSTITFSVAGKTCNLNGSARGSVPMGCNYTLTVSPSGAITGVLTDGNSVCTQSSQIAASCK